MSDHGSRTTDHAPPTVAVAFDRPADRDAAEALANRLNLPLARRFRDPHDLHLTRAADDVAGHRLELRVVAADHSLRGGHGVAADLTRLDTTSPAGRSLRTPVLKAVGVRSGGARPHVLDVTAGLGEDTWLLAAAGCRVTAIERHPLIHACCSRTPCVGRPAPLPTPPAGSPWDPSRKPPPRSSPSAADRPDVVLIDPMFPGRR